MAIGDPYNTRAQFKAALDITSTDEDDWIDLCLRGAARGIENRTGWPTFWNTVQAVTRTVDVTGRVVPVRTSGGNYTKILIEDGIASATGFEVSGFSSVTLLPTDAIDKGRPADSVQVPSGSTFTYGRITLTAVFGWPSVPDDIKWAHHMQTHRLYRRKGSPEGIAGSAEWGLSRVPRLDPDVLGILKDGGYMKPGIG